MDLPTLAMLLSSTLSGTTFYVHATGGSDGALGTSTTTAWQTLGRIADEPLSNGDVVRLARGEQWDEVLTIADSGNSTVPIVVEAYGTGVAPIIFGMQIDGAWTVFQDLEVDHDKQTGDAIQIRSAHNVILRRLHIHDGVQDAVDVDDADGLLIDSCHIHHFLNGTFDSQADAHGVVATDTTGITLRNTEIHHTSGDSFQADPDRDTDVSGDVLIEGCHLWTAPLASDWNGGWITGQRPGENAVDTKMVKDNWDAVPRMQLTIRDTVAHGWKADAYISNKAAFNLKEKIHAVVDRVTVFDNEIAFRIRGTRGNAEVTITNTVVYQNDKAIRAEDDLANLVINNSTFGNNTAQIQIANGGPNQSSWSFANDAFLGNVPSAMAAASNIAATATDFADAAAGNFHLPGGSGLIGAGVTLAEVTEDRDGNFRTPPYDVGAYEYCASCTATDGQSGGDAEGAGDSSSGGDPMTSGGMGDPEASDDGPPPNDSSVQGGCACSNAGPTIAWWACLAVAIRRRRLNMLFVHPAASPRGKA